MALAMSRAASAAPAGQHQACAAHVRHRQGTQPARSHQRLEQAAAKACWACAGTWTGPVSGSVWDARVSWADGNGAGNGGGGAAAEAPRTSMCCTTGMLPVSAAGQGAPGAAGTEPANNARDFPRCVCWPEASAKRCSGSVRIATVAGWQSERKAFV
eukprot:3249-Chlamydomonas_euryale.AAC.1